MVRQYAARHPQPGAQIAAVVGCSRNAVNIRPHRARKRLARALRAAGIDQAQAVRVAHLEGSRL